LVVQPPFVQKLAESHVVAFGAHVPAPSHISVLAVLRSLEQLAAPQLLLDPG
jgi:hypothetical protein